MVYKPQWKFKNLYPVSAETADERLKEIDREHGAVTPELLLESSRDETDVMHPCFEWNNDKAAEKYRVSQARNIIGNLVYVAVSESGEQQSQPTRAFVNVSGQKKSGMFKPIMTALSDEEMRRAVLENALKDLRDFRGKYSSLEELANVISAIDEVIGIE